MNFLETMVKIKGFFDLFGKKKPDPAESEGKAKRIILIVSLVLGAVLLLVAIALLVRKLKQRRLEKEAKQALDDYYSTDFDADEYDNEDEYDE